MDDNKLNELIELGKSGGLTPALRSKLGELAAEAMELERRIENGEALLKQLKAQQNKLLMKDIVDILNAVQLKEFTTTDDIEVQVATIVSGSLPKDEDKRRIAIGVLRAAGGGDLLTNEVSISFGKGEEEKAKAVLEAIGKLGFNHAVYQNDVHPQTLCAFVREKMAEGEPIDTEKLGVFVAPKAKVKRKKAKGAKRGAKKESEE